MLLGEDELALVSEINPDKLFIIMIFHLTQN